MEAWLGLCQLAKQGENSLKHFETIAAVYCADRRQYEAVLKSHVNTLGYQLRWAEDVQPFGSWAAHHAVEYGAAALAGAVHQENRVVLDALRAVCAGGVERPKSESYLTTKEIAGVEPLDAQMGAWPLKSAPDALMDPLFGQPEATSAEVTKYGDSLPPLKTYAILDAAKMPYLLTGLLEASNLHFQCLFQGDAEEDLGEVPPYLVSIENENHFTKALFTDLDPPAGLWSKDLGIFLRSRASFDELRRHFRRFTRVQDRGGKWRYFRFWEGRVASELLAHTNTPPKLSNIYLGDENCDIRCCIYRSFDGRLYLSQKTGAPVSQSDSKVIKYEDIEPALKAYSWKSFVVRVTQDFEKEFGPAGQMRDYQWIKETCDSAQSHGFKIELAIYNYVRSRHIAEIAGIDFQNALSWSHQQNPESSTLEISMHLWKIFDQARTREV